MGGMPIGSVIDKFFNFNMWFLEEKEAEMFRFRV